MIHIFPEKQLKFPAFVDVFLWNFQSQSSNATALSRENEKSHFARRNSSSRRSSFRPRKKRNPAVNPAKSPRNGTDLVLPNQKHLQ